MGVGSELAGPAQKAGCATVSPSGIGLARFVYTQAAASGTALMKLKMVRNEIEKDERLRFGGTLLKHSSRLSTVDQESMAHILLPPSGTRCENVWYILIGFTAFLVIDNLGKLVRFLKREFR